MLGIACGSRKATGVPLSSRCPKPNFRPPLRAGRDRSISPTAVYTYPSPPSYAASAQPGTMESIRSATLPPPTRSPAPVGPPATRNPEHLLTGGRGDLLGRPGAGRGRAAARPRAAPSTGDRHSDAPRAGHALGPVQPGTQPLHPRGRRGLPGRAPRARSTRSHHGRDALSVTRYQRRREWPRPLRQSATLSVSRGPPPVRGQFSQR